MATFLDFLLAKRGTTVDALPSNTSIGKAVRRYGVRASTEFKRIDALPRRVWTEDPELEELVELLTEQYRTPSGTQRLWPTQAIAIKEAFECRGLLGGIRVSGGKTIPSMLIPAVLEAERPVLFVPAKLRTKTEHAYATLREHWKLHPGLVIMNYEELSDARRHDWLLRYRPDLIAGDEAHKWRNPDSARTVRLDRYYEEREAESPGALTMILLSGTFYRKKPTDVQRLADMALRGGSPIPRTYKEADDWDRALDPKAPRPIGPGALLKWADPKAGINVTAVREGFGRRFAETPGVILSSGEGVDCALVIDAQIQGAHPEAEEHFERLRVKAEAIDGWELLDAPAIWAIAQQLELGFCYVWDPRPPQPWRDARKHWAAHVRERTKLRGSSIAELDAEAQVAAECVRLAADGRPVREYDDWVAIRPTFKPNVRPVWFSDRKVEQAAAWLRAKKGPGLVWTMHRAFGRRLSEVAGVPFYSNEGCDAEGNSIVHAEGAPAVVSCFGINEGFDLQDRWARNLYVCPMSPGEQWEQTLARTHRHMQLADEVSAEVWLGCTENYNALEGARAEEFAASAATLDRARKLVVADWVFPDPPTAQCVRLVNDEWRHTAGVTSWRWTSKFRDAE